MRIDGLWLPSDVGAFYPTVPAILDAAGREYPIEMLVDTGADG